MPVLLAIDSSPMLETAVTRRLTAAFVARWREAYPDGTVHLRDVGAAPPPHPDAVTLAAMAKPAYALTGEERRAVALSDALVSELLAADHVVLGSPMYNFTVTSGLKAWIDLVGRPGMTFGFTDSGPVGLLPEKRVVVFTGRGGFYAGAETGQEFQESYLRAFFAFMGITEIRFLHAEGQGIDPDTAREAELRVSDELEALFETGWLEPGAGREA